jgi:hypothetical protein
MILKYIPTCNCGAREGFITLLNNKAYLGLTTHFQDNGVFKDGRPLLLENNFCPACGAPREKTMVPDATDTEDDEEE